MATLLFKITFENVQTGKAVYFFINGIDDILSADIFNRQIKDAKTNEEFTIKSSILRQLEEGVEPEGRVV